MEENVNKNAAKLNNEMQKYYASYYKQYIAEYHEIIKPYIIDESTIDVNRWKKDLALDPKLNAKINNLESTIAQFSDFMNNEMQEKMQKSMYKSYEAGFVEMAGTFEVSKDVIKGLNKYKIETAIKEPFFKKSYSDLIWKNTEKMRETLTDVMRTSVIEGWGYKKAAKEFGDKVGASSYNAYRLIFTEHRFISHKAKQDAWTAMKPDVIVEIIHNRPPKCDLCAEKTGQLVRLSTAEIGVDIGPFHPNCTATIAPAVPNWLMAPSGKLADETAQSLTKYNEDYYKAK